VCVCVYGVCVFVCNGVGMELLSKVAQHLACVGCIRRIIDLPVEGGASVTLDKIVEIYVEICAFCTLF
jgi:hypothetical protein